MVLISFNTTDSINRVSEKCKRNVIKILYNHWVHLQEIRRKYSINYIGKHVKGLRGRSAVSAQLWAPHKIFTRAPLMVIYEKTFSTLCYI